MRLPMPIYEYVCEACGSRFSVLFWPPEQPQPRCTRCGAAMARRVISRVAALLGEEARLERLAEDAAGLDESDPLGLGRWARRAASELGEDSPEEFVDALQDASSESASES
ncbi:MAG: zinc ribbon domain-containing protein [Armatimonadota bacterium]|nr:zinc ribbon domain-containing protein [Armatimonadota bacterium]